MAAAGLAGVWDEIDDVQDLVGIGCGQLEKVGDFLLYGFIQNRSLVCEAGGFGDCGVMARESGKGENWAARSAMLICG